MNREIHLCNWASQPTIGIACSGVYTQPAWNQPTNLPEDVYETEENLLYTFLKVKVTCEKCKNI